MTKQQRLSAAGSRVETSRFLINRTIEELDNLADSFNFEAFQTQKEQLTRRLESTLKELNRVPSLPRDFPSEIVEESISLCQISLWYGEIVKSPNEYKYLTDLLSVLSGQLIDVSLELHDYTLELNRELVS